MRLNASHLPDVQRQQLQDLAAHDGEHVVLNVKLNDSLRRHLWGRVYIDHHGDVHVHSANVTKLFEAEVSFKILGCLVLKPTDVEALG